MMSMPWLHFTGGDYLFFRSWHPTSAGAIAGACIGLSCLAILDRWIAASRSMLESHWQRRNLVVTSKPNTDSLPSHNGLEKSESLDNKTHIQAKSGLNHPINGKRIIPPFIPMHDVPRGLIHAGQSLLAYIMMLAVMTFNAAYIISIVLGLGLGEVIFGRMGNGHNSAHPLLGQ